MDFSVNTPTGILNSNGDLNFLFSTNPFRRHTTHSLVLRTVFEVSKYERVELRREKMWYTILWYTRSVFNFHEFFIRDRSVARLLMFDMISLYKTWRHVKGYPSNGQRTWSNGKSASKNNNMLKSFRLHQMHTVYGTKKRTNFQILIQAEYNNRLWLKTWVSEWLQARSYCVTQKHAKTKAINVDIKSLALGITSGYKRHGKAAKFNKAKKALKIVTIGMPIYFTRYIFENISTRKFPHKVGIKQEDRKFKSKHTKKKVPKGGSKTSAKKK